jgi:hypothetical protein
MCPISVQTAGAQHIALVSSQGANAKLWANDWYEDVSEQRLVVQVHPYDADLR